MKTCHTSLIAILALTTTALAEPKAFELDDQTVALWNFADGEDSLYFDEGPGGFDVKVPQMEGIEPPVRIEGKFGSALSFAGSSRLDQATALPPMDLEDVITVEAWIRLPADEDPLGMGIIQYGNPTQDGFRLAVETTGELLWLISTDGSEIGVRSRVRLPAEEWIHVAGTYDGETMMVFLNGELENEKNVSGPTVIGQKNLIIGHFGGGGRPMFTGDINGIRVSNTARTEFDIN